MLGREKIARAECGFPQTFCVLSAVSAAVFITVSGVDRCLNRLQNFRRPPSHVQIEPYPRGDGAEDDLLTDNGGAWRIIRRWNRLRRNGLENDGRAAGVDSCNFHKDAADTTIQMSRKAAQLLALT